MNTLSIAHDFFRRTVRTGGFCIDATAGNGRDTALLCSLVGEGGRVLAFDIQPTAVENTRRLLDENGFSGIGTVILDSHGNMAAYAEENSADLIVFNLGRLPGGDPGIFTRAESTISAIDAGLRLLKDGGAMSISVYYGGSNGYSERDALLEYIKTIDNSRFTVLKTEFCNRSGDVPISLFIFKSL